MKMLVAFLFAFLFAGALGEEVKELTKEQKCSGGLMETLNILEGPATRRGEYSAIYGLAASLIKAHLGTREQGVIDAAMKETVPLLNEYVDLSESNYHKKRNNLRIVETGSAEKSKKSVTRGEELKGLSPNLLHVVLKSVDLRECAMAAPLKSSIRAIHAAARDEAFGVSAPTIVANIESSVIHPVGALVEESVRFMNKREDLTDEEKRGGWGGYGGGYGGGNAWGPGWNKQALQPGYSHYMENKNQYAPSDLVSEYLGVCNMSETNDYDIFNVRAMIYAQRGCYFFEHGNRISNWQMYRDLYQTACNSHTICYLCGNGTSLLHDPNFPYNYVPDDFNGNLWIAKWPRDFCDMALRTRMDQICRLKYVQYYELNELWDCLATSQLMFEDIRENGARNYAKNSPLWCLQNNCVDLFGNPYAPMEYGDTTISLLSPSK